MDIFDKDNQLYDLQEAWNMLEPDALFMDQYELADKSGVPSSSWTIFLKDGQVQKYIQTETQLFSQAQQRKLIARATSNDKSVGTAQMIGAIDRINSSEEAETNFFIYSHVPLTINEAEAPGTTQDLRWLPPETIQEITDTPVIPTLPKAEPTVIKPDNRPTEVNPDEWF